MLIDKFRSIKENDTFTDSIVSKRIKIKIEEEHSGLTNKIMRETELSLPKRIQELRDLKISGYSKIEKKIKNNAGLNEKEKHARELREDKFQNFSNDELDFLDIKFPAKQLKITPKDETRLFHSAFHKENDLTKEIYNEWVNLDPDRFEKWEIIKPPNTKDSPYYDWYQFCRYCLIDYERVEYMQERIWRIYDMYEEYYRFDKPVYFKFDSLSQDSTSKGFNFPIDFARIRFLEEKAKELRETISKLQHELSSKNEEINEIQKRAAEEAAAVASANKQHSPREGSEKVNSKNKDDRKDLPNVANFDPAITSNNITSVIQSMETAIKNGTSLWKTGKKKECFELYKKTCQNAIDSLPRSLPQIMRLKESLSASKQILAQAPT